VRHNPGHQYADATGSGLVVDRSARAGPAGWERAAKGTLRKVQFVFRSRADGIIDAVVEPGYPVLNHALEDSVSSRAPRGAEPGLSTYWIELAEERADQAVANGLVEPFATGNVTYLRLEGDRVVAGYEFDGNEDEAESLPLEAFLRLLAEWKNTVIDAGGVSGSAARPEPTTQQAWRLGSGDGLDGGR
jgi:hypothetical protein